MALDKTQPWQAITFRNSPDEYPYTHAVFVGPDMVVGEATCGLELPETMRADIESFGQFINMNWISCPACQVKISAVAKVSKYGRRRKK